MISPAHCSAIYVPIEFRHDIEAWLVESYNLKLLPAKEVILSMSSKMSTSSQDSRSQTASCPDSKHSMSGRSRNRRAEIVCEMPAKVSNQNLGPNRLSSSKLRDFHNRRRTSSRETSNSDCFKRLYQVRPKIKSLPEENIKKSVSTVSSEHTDKVFRRLYQSGMAQKKKQREKAEAEKKTRDRKEEEEIQRGRALGKLYRECDGYRMSAKELAEKEKSFKETRLSKSEVRLMSKRLSQRSKSAPIRKTEDDKECTFRPITNVSPRFSLQEHNDRFEKLYKDGKRKLLHREDEAEMQWIREKKAILNQRLLDDIAFRRRVDENPAVADEFMRALK